MKNSNLFTKSSLTDLFKKYKLAFIYSFSFGALLSTIPHTYKLLRDYRIEKLIKQEMQFQLKEKEKKCKDKNSDYNKFLNLGFPKTAMSKFTICMQEK